MRTDKDKAFSMRRAGKSYREIHTELGMSMSTLSNWFAGVDFSEEIKQAVTEKAQRGSTKRIKTLNKARGAALAAHYEQAEREAAAELEKNINNPLFVSAVAAYWGEGDKQSRNQVRLTNTDPKMLKLFVVFLQECCYVPKNKIRLAVFIYNDLDEGTCKKFWSRQTGIMSFHKTQTLPSRHKTKRLSYGVCTVVVSNTYLKKKVDFWIDQLPKMVLNTVPQKRKRL